MWRIGTKSSHVWRIGTKFSHLCKSGINSSNDNWYQNSHVWRTDTKCSHVKNWYQVITHMKHWYLIVTDVSNKTLKNWNRMQNAVVWGGGGGEFYHVFKNTHVFYMKLDFVRIFHKVWDIGSKYVTYWYQFFTCCEELVAILHSVKYEVWNLRASMYPHDVLW